MTAVDYAAPNDRWEPWFADYQFGAIYIFPPEPVRTWANGLRQQYDAKAQAICEAHISLTVPVQRPLTDQDAAELAEVARSYAEFAVAYGLPGAYAGVPGVVLPIEPAGHIAAIVQRLETCAVFAGAPARRYPFSPHLTLAEFITLERTAEILAELGPSARSGEFRCSALSYAVPDGDFRFTERLAWPLG